jgi:putative endonuclease
MPLFHVYILFSLRDRGFYIGFTTNIEQRMYRHNIGHTPSTTWRRPLRLVFYESFLNKYDALRRERYFKTTKGKTTLRQMLRRTLENFSQR